MVRRKSHTCLCEVCRRSFQSSRYDALTCSPKCRQAKRRGIVAGQGKGWYAVRPEYRDMVQTLSHVCSTNTMNELSQVLYISGAVAAEWAIAALVHALADVGVEIVNKSEGVA